MGKRNYLISGVSGSGKTTVCTELERRGYQAIHGDRALAYLGDPETGQPVDGPKSAYSPEFISRHHIWNVQQVQALVANQDHAVTFFCGGAQNYDTFIELFDGIFILEVDFDTMNRRIDERVAVDPTDWGGTQAERDITARMYRAREGVPATGTLIDATAPLTAVVDEIIRLSGVYPTIDTYDSREMEKRA